ncbi:hypothetical protein XM47_02570 [Catenovulum maritimum]|uniref:Uncharacterized protein n=1 Tax=Catenovulum maritimum TaxID=1513271 RepID=A0A0J8GUM2_9ALTE|nr:hypothetical protein XM47_02570 [Catenovulum maritimum]
MNLKLKAPNAIPVLTASNRFFRWVIYESYEYDVSQVEFIEGFRRMSFAGYKKADEAPSAIKILVILASLQHLA